VAQSVDDHQEDEMKGHGAEHPHQYRRGATRWSGRPQQTIVAQDAKDEVEAYYALKRIKSRAKREREEKRLQERPKITLPIFSFSEKPVAANDNERLEAEQRMIACIQQAIESSQASLSELTHIPNPHSTFKNRIDQRAIIEALRRLANCVRPPIKLEEKDAA
jgi:hypothetical protein